MKSNYLFSQILLPCSLINQVALAAPFISEKLQRQFCVKLSSVEPLDISNPVVLLWLSPAVSTSIVVHSVLMGPQYKSGVCFHLPKKGFLHGLVATGLSELIRGESVAGNGQGSQFFPPLHCSLRKRQEEGAPFLGLWFYFCTLGTLSSSSGLHSWCSRGYSFIFWAVKGAQFILS